jgi:hypothetical protein
MSVAKVRRHLLSLTGWQHWLADRRTGRKHRSSERPPLSATEWIVGNPEVVPAKRRYWNLAARSLTRE